VVFPSFPLATVFPVSNVLAVAVLFSAIFTGAEVTVTVHVAVKLPSCVVTVMVAVPAATPVTKPEVLTVATAVLPEIHDIVLFVAFDGMTVAVNWLVLATPIETVAGLSDTPVTATLAAATVTAQVAVLAPSCVVAVIVAVPAAMAVTKPEVFTIAMAVLPELHVTVLLVAFAGRTVAVNWLVPPATMEAVVGLTLTLVTAIGAAVTVMADVAVKLPYCVVAVIVEVPTATALTNPLELTVATEVLPELHITVLSVAVVGATVAVNWLVAPATIDAVTGLTLTPVTGTLAVEPHTLNSKKLVQ
jgi:hypothetical protein